MSALFITFFIIVILCSPLKVDLAIEEMKTHKQHTAGGNFILSVRSGYITWRLCFQDYINMNFLTFHFHFFFYIFTSSSSWSWWRKSAILKQHTQVGLGGGVCSTDCHSRFDHAASFRTVTLSWTEYWNLENIDLVLIVHTRLHHLKLQLSTSCFSSGPQVCGRRTWTTMHQSKQQHTSAPFVSIHSNNTVWERPFWCWHCHLVSSEKHVITQWLAAWSI